MIWLQIDSKEVMKAKCSPKVATEVQKDYLMP